VPAAQYDTILMQEQKFTPSTLQEPKAATQRMTSQALSELLLFELHNLFNLHNAMIVAQPLADLTHTS